MKKSTLLEKEARQMGAEKTINEIRELLTQIGRRVREDDVETAGELIWILNHLKGIKFRIDTECLDKEK